MTGPRRVVAAVLVLALGLSVVAVLALELGRLRGSLREQVFEAAQAATRAAATEIERNHQELVTLVRGLAADLGARDVPSAEVELRLVDEARRRPRVFSIVVVFPAESVETLVAPVVVRSAEGPRIVHLEQSYDVRLSDWYGDVADHPEPGWHGPFFGPATGHFIAYYCEPWSRPDRPDVLGHVCGTWSLNEIEALRLALPAGRFGYTWLLSHEARSLAHPDIDWMRSARTPEQEADEIDEPRLREVGRLAIAGRAGTVRAVDPLTRRDAVMFQEPIPTSGWSLVAVVLQDDILAGEPSLRQRQLDIVLLLLSTLGATVALMRPRRAAVSPWWLSMGAAVALAAGIVVVWSLELRSFDPSRARTVVDTAAVERFVDELLDRTGRRSMPRPAQIETGLELRTIVFPGPHNVIVTGYVWQLYPPTLPRAITRGVVFPDTIVQDDDVMQQAWRIDTPRGEVVGWFFRTTLYQPYDHAKFPIDERRVVLRVWHADPTEDVVLVPHFAAYHAMFPALRPGLRDQLVMPGWRAETSEFVMTTTTRRTGFGLPGFAAEGEAAELGFEVRLTRDFTNAFVSNLLPLMIVAVLLFGVLMTVTLDRERAERHGFTTSAAYATNAALLFVALVGHLRIREEVTTPQILYLEYFYFIAYLMILAVSVIVFVAATPGSHSRVITDGDVMLPKLLYWPLSLASFFAITMWVFY